MSNSESKKVPAPTVSLKTQHVMKTDQINLRLPLPWINALCTAAAELEDETGEEFNMQDIIKMCLMEKFGLTS